MHMLKLEDMSFILWMNFIAVFEQLYIFNANALLKFKGPNFSLQQKAQQ